MRGSRAFSEQLTRLDRDLHNSRGVILGPTVIVSGNQVQRCAAQVIKVTLASQYLAQNKVILMAGKFSVTSSDYG